MFRRLFRRKCSYFVVVKAVNLPHNVNVSHVIDFHEPLTLSNYPEFEKVAKEFFRNAGKATPDWKFAIKSVSRI